MSLIYLSVRLYKKLVKCGSIWDFQTLLSNKHGEELVRDVNVRDDIIVTPILNALNNWYGEIEVETGGELGKLTIGLAMALIHSPIAKFSVGIAIN